MSKDKRKDKVKQIKEELIRMVKPNVKAEVVRESDYIVITTSIGPSINTVIYSIAEAQSLMKDLEANLHDYWVEQHGMD